MIFEVINFQSIKKETFEFKSLTSIVGPTDRGKSALYRALLCHFYNEWEDGFLRRGTKKCILTSIFPEKNIIFDRIIQEKGKSINTYCFKFKDGRKDIYIPKAGVKIPDLLKEIGFDIIETERKDRFNLNFQDQYDPLFLVAQSKPLVTSFFNHIFKITQYERALRRLTSDNIKLNQEYEANEEALKNKKEECKNVEDEINQITKQLEDFKSLFNLYSRIKNEIKQYDKGIEKVNQFNNLVREIKEDQIKIEYITKVNNSIQNYSEKFKNYSTLNDNLGNLLMLSNHINVLYKSQNLLNMGSEKVNNFFIALQSYLNIINKMSRFNDLRCSINYLSTQDKDLKNKVKIIGEYFEKLQKTIKFLECFNRISFCNHFIVKLTEDSRYLENFSKFLEPLLKYEEFFKVCYTYKERLIETKNKLDVGERIKIELLGEQKKILDYESFINSVISVCPLCKKPLCEESH